MWPSWCKLRNVLLRIFFAAPHFTNDGVQRIQFMLVPLMFAALSLARRVLAREQAVAAGDGDGSEE